MERASSDRPDILIVTVTDIESDAVIAAFKAGSARNYEYKSLQELVYFDFGIIGGARVWMVRSGMGTDGSTGSTITIQKAIKEAAPEAIIMVGIAFGLKQGEHKIGDILISRQVVAYESQKIGPAGIKARGDRMPATARIFLKFESMAQEWSKSEDGVPVYCGLILSGNKLVDKLDFRNQLIDLEPEAIGGEMEGAGLSAAAYENHVDWILIKAISDWGDGNKDEDKHGRQTLAAGNAARLTHYVLEKGNIVVRSAKTTPANFESHSSNEIVKKVEKAFVEESITEIEQQLSSSNYKSAVEIGRKVSQSIGFQFELDNPEIELLYGKFWTFFAIALIYSEGTEEAFPILNRVVKRLEKRGNLYKQLDSSSALLQGYHLVLGRAYNHLGYGYWMDKGCYGAALKEFHNGLSHFTEGKWEQETATAYDNLGRVYAQLGHRMHAEFLIGHSLNLRKKTRNEYRLALSLNSSAILHLSYGNPLRAVLESEEALYLFKLQSKKHGSRGLGLALITKGRALRMLASHWRYTTTYHDIHRYLSDAITVLEEAEQIFSSVDEDIRVLQTYKELGCAYRESFLMSREESDEEKARLAAKKAERYYDAIISSTDSRKKYPLLYVDVCHDIALFYFIQEKTSMAEEFLNKALGHIPPAYRVFREEVDSRFSEDYWQILGKIYSLKGDLAFRMIRFPPGYANGESLCDDSDDKSRQKLEETFKYYVQSAAYFGRFLAVPVVSSNYPLDTQSLESHFRFAQKLYEKLSSLNEKDLRFLRSGIYQQTIIEHQLDASWIEPFFNQAYDLLIREAKM